MKMWCPNDKQDFESNTTGQITPNGAVGKTLIRYIKDVKNIVEIGTWNGLGSTRCFLMGLQPETKFYTLETNKDKYLIAQENLKSLVTPNVNFLWGSILKPEDVKDVEVVFPEMRTNSEFRRWHSLDMANLANSPNVRSELPEQIEFLLLDGGEFTTWYEFVSLFRSCSRYIALDDVNVSKSKKIREYLKMHAFWTEVEYIPERNGFSLFKRM